MSTYKRRNRKFIDRTGETYGDFSISKTVRSKKYIKYELICNRCKSTKQIFNTNYTAKESSSCLNCKMLFPIGKRLGMLEIVSVIDKKASLSKIVYSALCDCGKKTTISRKAFLNAKKHSCGCKGIDAQEIIIKYKMNQYKHGAHSRGLVFNLQYEDFKKLILDKCYYCGSSPKTVDLKKMEWIADFRKNKNTVSNGIDRVNNELGYTIENVVSCCTECNTKKMSVTPEMAKKILDFINKKNLNNMVCIEISKGDIYKYEIDKQTGVLKIDRPLNQECPANYGYFNLTLAEDGDPTDVFVISNDRITNTAHVDVIVLGAYICTDNGESDDKIVSILSGETWNDFISIQKELDKIYKYLSTYKLGFVVHRAVGPEEALKIIEKSKEKYIERMKKTNENVYF